MIRWFRQFWAISRNSFTVSISDPVFLILMVATLVAGAFFAALPSFSFGQELRLIRDQSMALIFIGGCLVAMLSAVTAVVRDVRQGAISVLMSRPVSSFSVIVGKWAGLAGALILYHIPATIACLWITRIVAGGHSGHQELDGVAMGVYVFSIILALGLMGLRHYFFGGWYVWQASLAVPAFFLGCFLLSNFFGEGGSIQHWGEGVDWRTVLGCVLVLFAELIFLGLILPFAVSQEAPMVMGMGVVIFFLGMISQYLAGAVFDPGILRTAARALLPNWQAFWISDLLAVKGDFEVGSALRYILNCLIHTVSYVAVCLCVAAFLFNQREFSGNDTL